MKLAIVLGLVIAGLCLGGAAYYQHSTGTQDKLQQDLNEAIKTNSSLIADLATAKANVEGLNKELAKARAKADSMAEDMGKWKEEARIRSAEAADATRRAEALSFDLNEVKARLIDATQSITRSAAQNDALAGILAKQTALDKLITSDLATAVAKANADQTRLMVSPSRAAYESFRSSLQGGIDICARSVASANDLGNFADEHQSRLAESDAALKVIMDRISESRAKLAPIHTALEETFASCREGEYTVMANEAWQQAELTVTPGENVAVQPLGDWVYAPTSKRRVTADGENWEQGSRVVKGTNDGALLSRVRGSQTVHPGGGYLTADKVGLVEFRINDTDLADNHGTIDVKMWAFKPLRQQ